MTDSPFSGKVQSKRLWWGWMHDNAVLHVEEYSVEKMQATIKNPRFLDSTSPFEAENITEATKVAWNLLKKNQKNAAS